VAELIALAKKKPGELSYASNGPGSLNHLTSAMLRTRPASNSSMCRIRARRN